jgi:hypothetical protein
VVIISHITEQQFIKIFVSIITGKTTLPRKQLYRHILFISFILTIDPARKYTEKEFNGLLHLWLGLYGDHLGLDYVALRRYLVDERYIQREADGGNYQLLSKEPRFTYDRSIERLDLQELINTASREKEQQRQRYLHESKH